MRHLTICFLFFALLPFGACKRGGIIDGGSESVQFQYINDTDFDCLIEWKLYGEDTFENVHIASSEQYVQILPSMSTSDRMDDGRTCLAVANEIRFSFEGGADKTEYVVTYEEGTTISSTNCFWSRLPHYKHESLHNPPEVFTSIRTSYLSDVLSLAKESSAL